MVASKLKRSGNEGDANRPPVAVLNVAFKSHYSSQIS